jgi:flagellar motor switch protein FliN/FliY
MEENPSWWGFDLETGRMQTSSSSVRLEVEGPSSTESHSKSLTGAVSLDVRRILGLRMPVSVTLAEREMPLRAVLEITVGTIIEFDVPVDAELSLSVANRAIGKGYAVKSGENFGLRVTLIGSVHQRIDAMGGRDAISLLARG